MSAMRLALSLVLLACVVFQPQRTIASAFVRGAYYRLGDDDPGAIAGTIGNNPTQDSFGDNLDLERFGSPRYWRDVPPQGPFGSTLSMAFANEGLGGPAFPGFYGRDDSLPMVEHGYALEAWVNAGPTNLDSIRTNLIAYNGRPETNVFGFFLHADDYVARIGTFERSLGPATIGKWHHLAYVQSLGTASYYYDGKLVHETSSDLLPSTAVGGFWLGGISTGPNDEGAYLFNGWIDEVRYQSFNPLVAGLFEPTDFLIREPPLPGDFDRSGTVDAADYVIWRDGFGTSYDQTDYDAWRANFGTVSPDIGTGRGSELRSAAPLSPAVPEPPAMVICILSVVLLLCPRRVIM